MELEVEQKFPLLDRGGLEQRLLALGAVNSSEAIESDLYFNHPVRDFAKTDEALRVRRVGSQTCITYKGPKLDPHTKTRQELELSLPSDESLASPCTELFRVLSFRPIAEVVKLRTRWRLSWQGFDAQVVIDEVHEVGQYAEVEVVTAREQQETAQTAIHALAAALGLEHPERRSYLELLLVCRARPAESV